MLFAEVFAIIYAIFLQEDLDLLYLEEKEKMENEKKEEMMKRNAAIPGMVQQEEGEGMEDDI